MSNWTHTFIESFSFITLLLSLSFSLFVLHWSSRHIVSFTWGCRGHVRLSCGWPPVDRSSGASSRRQRRIYYKLTWSYLRCCCSPMDPSISSFCKRVQGERKQGENQKKHKKWITILWQKSNIVNIYCYFSILFMFFNWHEIHRSNLPTTIWNTLQLSSYIKTFVS